MSVTMSTLGVKAAIIMGQSPPGESYNKSGQGAPLLNGPTEFGPRNPTAKQWTTNPKKFCIPGDVLFCVRGATAGRLNIADKEYCLGRGLAAIRGKKNTFNTEFLRYVLANGYARFQSRGVGSTFINISADELAKFPVPDLPLTEQKRIAGILDAADALRAKRREALAQLDSLLQSSFLDLFGDPVTNPMGWPVRAMESVSEILTGFAFPSGKYLSDGNGIALCRGINVGLGCLSWDERVDWTSPHEESLNRYELKLDDIILAMDRPWINGGLKTATVREYDLPSLLVQRVARIRAKDPTAQTLLYALIRHPIFERHCKPTETTIPHISPRELKSFQIIWPPLTLQQKFATIVESVERQKKRQRAHLAELDALFAALQHRAFRGEL